MKKLISIILTFLMIMCTYSTVLAVEYAPNTYSLDFNFIKESVGCTLSGNALTVLAGGYAVFSDELLLSAASVTVKTKNNEGSIKLECGDQTVELSFGGGNEQTVEFGHPVHKNTENITVYGVSDTIVTDIIFNRVALDFPSTAPQLTLPDISNEEYNILSAFIIKQDSNVYLTNGATRYINYENPHDTVKLINGKMYAPAKAVATGLHLYYESIPEKAYLLMRKDNETEFLASSDVSYVRTTTDEEIPIENPVTYIDGVPYIPVRQLCELFGETVTYRDGYVVIDSYKNATKITNDEAIWNYATSKFDGFNPKYTGKTYHVAQTANASDLNDGSEAAPFNTIAVASAVAKAGDTILIHEGTYRETVRPQSNGTAAAPITYKAASGENVTVSALEQVNSFATYPLNNVEGIVIGMMESTLPQGRNMVFHNGVALGEGRHPNADTADPERCKELNLSPLWPTFGDIVLRDYTEEEKALSSKPKLYELVSENDLNQEDNYWAGATYIGLNGSGWSMSTGKVASSTNGSLTVDSKQVTTTWWYGKKSTGDFGFLTNHINTVDAPGEWYVDDTEKILYVCLPEGETANSLKLEYKARQLVFDLTEKNHIIIEGIHTIGGGVTMHDGDMNVINNCNLEYISHYSYSDDQRDGFIDDKKVRTDTAAPARGEVGIYIDGDSCVVANSRINHSAAAAIYSAGSYGLYENNYITDCGYMGSYVAGITMEGPGWETAPDYKRGGDHVYKNTIRRAGRSCLSMASVVDGNKANVLPMDICYNDISDGMISGRDGGTVYEHGSMVGTDIERGKFHHNLIFNQWEPSHNPRGGLYHDNWVLNQESFDNMIFFNNSVGMDPRVYTQNKAAFPTTYAKTYEWGNTRFDGFDSLTIDEVGYKDYPGGRPFQLGSSLEKGVFTYNYDNRNADNGWYSAKGELTKDSYVTFENVDFGDGKNVLSVYFSGDKYNTEEKIDIIIGDSIETGKRIRTEITANTTELDYNFSEEIVVGATSGVQNVYIEAVDYKSLKVHRLTPYKDTDKMFVIERLYGGEYSELTAGDKNQIPVHKYLSSDPRHSYINNTWIGTTLKYEDVEITSDFNAFVWAAGTSGIYSGNSVTVYFDSLDSEPVGSFVIDTQNWTDFSEKTVMLNKTVEKGTYDVYIVFGESGKSCDWYYLGFASK